jgi:hypothetical protein
MEGISFCHISLLLDVLRSVVHKLSDVIRKQAAFKG